MARLLPSDTQQLQGQLFSKTSAATTALSDELQDPNTQNTNCHLGVHTGTCTALYSWQSPFTDVIPFES